MTTRNRPVVAIDGPAGAGKSTVSQALARALGYSLIETGAIYRSVALVAQERGIDWSAAMALAGIAADLPIRFLFAAEHNRVWLADRDVTEAIRAEAIGLGASQVSAHAQVRQALLQLQRQLGERGGVVLEGRDIGTVVFPDAEVKFFLDASPEERARRRILQLREQGQTPDAPAVLAALRNRDQADSTRAVAPLAKADDAILIWSDGRSREQIVEQMTAIVAQTAARMGVDFGKTESGS